MIDIDDIYEACRSCDQRILQLQVRMLMLRDALRSTRSIYIGSVSIYVNGALIAAAERMIPHRDAHAEALKKLEQSLVIKPLTVNDFKEFEPTRERRKAQWKDEARMRNGRNWKR